MAPDNAGMRKIAIAAFKGGVGKTTCATNISVALARRGKRVLLLDCDSQSNCTDSLGVASDATLGLYGLLTGGADLAMAAVNVESNLDLVPGSRALSGIDPWLLARPRPSDMLRVRLEGLTDYDFVICDMPPSFGSVSLNCLMFADECWLPCAMEYLALQGIKQVLDTLKMLRDEAEHVVKVRYVIPTFYDKRNSKTESIMRALEKNFKERVLAPVRCSVRLSEAPGHHRSIFDYSPQSSGAEDYQRISEAILNG